VIQIWNSTAAELFGHLPEEAVGRPLDIIIPEHLRPAQLGGLREGGGFRAHEARNTRREDSGHPKDGHKLYVSLAFSVVKDREGKVIGAMATARPFTEDKTQ
jgi:PAS domain S-box-containing protein